MILGKYADIAIYIYSYTEFYTVLSAVITISRNFKFKALSELYLYIFLFYLSLFIHSIYLSILFISLLYLSLYYLSLYSCTVVMFENFPVLWRIFLSRFETPCKKENRKQTES